LPDYTTGEFKKEIRLLDQARKAGTLKEINTTDELVSKPTSAVEKSTF